MIARRLLAAAISFVVVACQQQEPITKSEDMRTIESEHGGSLPVEAAPTLQEQVNVPAPTASAPGGDAKKNAAQAQEEALKRRMDLPFAPAIAMDPVDGQKVSITTLTPVTEYKNKIYYFTSEANRREFLANPEPFAKGQLARY